MAADRMDTAVAAWSALQRAKEWIEEDMDAYARVIEQRAKKFLVQPSSPGPRITRTGQYPTLVNITEKGAEFHVTNGMDLHDDFEITIPIADLYPEKETVGA